jgi:hypothetical protein
MKVRNAAFLPLSKPMKANHAGATEPFNQVFTDNLPIFGSLGAITNRKRECDRGASKIRNMNGSKEFGVVAGSCRRPTLNLTSLCANVIILHRGNPSR